MDQPRADVPNIQLGALSQQDLLDVQPVLRPISDGLALDQHFEIGVVRGARLTTHSVRDPPDDGVWNAVRVEEGIYLP